jgi:SAM-dependent methyltransferase
MELNGDLRLSVPDRIRYLVQNAKQNLSAFARPAFQQFKGWRPPRGALESVAARTASPGRKLAEAFVVFGLPQHLQPGEISVLEIGCGSGRARDLLARAGYSGRYTGLDVYDRFDFEARFPDFVSEFRLLDAHEIEPEQRYDLILSNSALEHIDNDVALVDRLRQCLRPGGVQFHIVPSGAALFAYLWHGYRQYAGGALALRFNPAASCVFPLGGLASLAVHILWITLPEQLGQLRLRNHFPGTYAAATKLAVALDRVFGFGAPMYVVIEHAVQEPSDASVANT